MENYEKKYKEALEKARQLCAYPTSKPFISDLQDLFPELAESEDERIRKELVEFVDINTLSTDERHDRWISWLEKQGEQKPTKNIVESWKDMRLEVYQQASGNRHEPNYSDDTTKMFSLNDIDEIIEKMSEQKPADKVEPKFKVGQWIVWQDKCYKVNYNGCGYELVDQNGLSTSLEYGTVEESAHVFAIQDAKDGDVLCYEKDEVEWIFIYREIVPAVSEVPLDLLRYYFLLEGNYINWNGVNAMVTDDYELYLKPATEEQRDLLFQKMKEAVYEWDAEKKELKKIEQKPAWSEEDEQYLLVCKNALAKYQVSDKWDAHIISCWLEKRLKSPNSKPKQEWSEEDEAKFEGVVFLLKQALNKGSIPEYMNWLKSLKDRYTWKPSDEQMKQLHKYCIDNKPLNDLYEQLKAL